jgi:hypothetical protein
VGRVLSRPLWGFQGSRKANTAAVFDEWPLLFSAAAADPTGSLPVEDAGAFLAPALSNHFFGSGRAGGGVAPPHW